MPTPAFEDQVEASVHLLREVERENLINPHQRTAPHTFHNKNDSFLVRKMEK